MKKFKLVFAIFATIVMIASCKKECQTVCKNGGTVTPSCDCDCPPGYTGAHCETPPPPACQTNQWTYISFKNTSNATVQKVLFDGAVKEAKLYPGQTSSLYTTNKGSHTIEFRNYYTNATTCSKITVNLAQCAVNTYSCSY